jgi:metal-responsive CopG/Arc/MetJ family transcriptional regulator
MALIRTNVHLEEETLEAIDKLVAPQHLSRAWFIRKAIDAALTRVKARKSSAKKPTPKR